MILSAALGLLAPAACMAQVYSENAVGYYTLTLNGGFNLVANNLNNGDNGINTVMDLTAGVPDSTAFQKWDGANQMFANFATYIDGLGFVDDTFTPVTFTLAPGEGAFLQVPFGATASIVLVGEVPEDTLTLDLVPGFQIISQTTSQAIDLDASGFPAADGDALQRWIPGDANSDAGFLPIGGYIDGLGWVDDGFNPIDTTLQLGQAFFYQRSAGGGNVTWTRTFNVSPP